MEKEKILNIINSSTSRNEVIIKYFGYSNKLAYYKLNLFIIENNIDVSHLNKKENKCLFCGGTIKKRNKFCNNSCAAKHNNKKRKHSNETKYKISESLRKNKKIHLNNNNFIFNDRRNNCLNCNKELLYKQKLTKNIFCSISCSAKYRYNINDSIREKNRIAMKKRIELGKHKGWNSRNIISYPEKIFMKVLDNYNIKYNHNYPINKRNLGLNETSNYFLDFFIKEKNIDLEIDGQQHKNRKFNDNKRDYLLIKNNFIVYRIKWKNINNNIGKKYIKNEIEKFIIFYNSIESVV